MLYQIQYEKKADKCSSNLSAFYLIGAQSGSYFTICRFPFLLLSANHELYIDRCINQFYC